MTGRARGGLAAVVAALALLAGAGAAHAACTLTFNGSVSSDWSTAANWTPNGVPVSNTDTCLAGHAVTVGSDARANSISGGSLTLTAGNFQLGGGGAALANYTQSGGTLAPTDAATAVTLTGAFGWSGGVIATPMSQTGGGAFSISGTTQATLSTKTISTTSPVSISNLALSAYDGHITTTGTMTIAPGSYRVSTPAFGKHPLTLTAAAFALSPATVLPDEILHPTANMTVPSSMTLYGLDAPAGVTVTIPASTTVSAETGTIAGTLTGAGTLATAVPPGQLDYGGGTVDVTPTGTLSAATLTITGGPVTFESGATDGVAAMTLAGSVLAAAGTSIGHLTQTGGTLGGTPALTGPYIWSGGTIAGHVGHTGGGVTIAGAGTPLLSDRGSLQTTGDVAISNPHLGTAADGEIADPPSITTSGAVSFAAGTYDVPPVLDLRIDAPKLTTAGPVTARGADLRLSAAGSSLGGSLSLGRLDTTAAAPVSVPSGTTLRTDAGTLAGAITGPGTFAAGSGATSVAAGATLSPAAVDVDASPLVAGAGLTVAAAAHYAPAATSVSGGTLALGGAAQTGTYVQSGGALDGPGTLGVGGVLLWSGGHIGPVHAVGVTQSGGGAFDIGGAGTPTLDAGTLSTSSPVSITSPALQTSGGAGSLTTTSTLTLGSGAVVDHAGDGHATFTAAGFDPGGGPVSGFSGDALRLTGGSATVGAGHTLLAGGGLDLAGADVRDDGAVQAPTTIDGGTLSGGGTVRGGLTDKGGTVAPSGALTVTGDYAQRAGGTLQLSASGAGEAQHDSLQVGGAATLDGALKLALGSYTPAAGDTLALLRYGGARTGTFASTATGPLSVGYGSPGAVTAGIPVAGPPTTVTTPAATTAPAPSKPVTPAAPAPTASQVATALGLPSATACVRTRRLTLHAKATVTLGGKKVAIRSVTVRLGSKTLVKKRKPATIAVRLPASKARRFTVTVSAVTRDGRTLTGTRTYRVCQRRSGTTSS